MNCCATFKLNIFWVIIEFFKSCRYISLSHTDPQIPTSTVMNLTFHPEQYDYFCCNEFWCIYLRLMMQWWTNVYYYFDFNVIWLRDSCVYFRYKMKWIDFKYDDIVCGIVCDLWCHHVWYYYEIEMCELLTSCMVLLWDCSDTLYYIFDMKWNEMISWVRCAAYDVVHDYSL